MNDIKDLFYENKNGGIEEDVKVKIECGRSERRSAGRFT